MPNEINMDGKKCLVTGGAGFIGSSVAEELLRLGADVVVLDDLSGGFKSNLPSGCKFLKGSINNNALINSLFGEYYFNYVYHLAAYAAEGLSHFIRKYNYNNNLIGSINLINAAIKADVECFVFTSSIAVYGAGSLPMSEENTLIPEDPYGIAKLAIELDLKAAHDIFGLNYIIFRPHNVYGPHQNIGDMYRNVVGIFMNQLMSDKPLTIFGNGNQTRSFSYIDDVAPIIAKSTFFPEAYNEIFNIGADIPYTIKDLAIKVCEAMGKEAIINYLPARKEVVHAHASHEKVKKYFGMEAKISLSEGLQRMANWAKKVGARKSKPFKNVEIWKNMPSSWQSVVLKK